MATAVAAEARTLIGMFRSQKSAADMTWQAEIKRSRRERPRITLLVCSAVMTVLSALASIVAWSNVQYDGGKVTAAVQSELIPLTALPAAAAIALTLMFSVFAGENVVFRISAKRRLTVASALIPMIATVTAAAQMDSGFSSDNSFAVSACLFWAASIGWAFTAGTGLRLSQSAHERHVSTADG